VLFSVGQQSNPSHVWWIQAKKRWKTSGLVRYTQFDEKESPKMPKITLDLPPVQDVDEATVRAEMRQIIRDAFDEIDEEALNREVEREVEKWKQSRKL
jgi:hypothetical protein